MAKKELSEKIWEKSAEWVDEIGRVIGELAKQLGVASEHVYTVYTKQIFFEGLVKASISGGFVILLFLANLFVWFSTRKHSEEGKWVPRIIGAIVFLFISLMIVPEVFVPNALKALNPEYYTIKEIVDMIGGLIKKE